MFDGLGREGLRGAAGGGGALSPQRFMAHTLGSPTGHKAQVKTSNNQYYREESMFVSKAKGTQDL